VLAAAGVAVGGSTFAAHPAASSHTPHAWNVSLTDVRASTTNDSRASTECKGWIAVGGGGPANATLTSATDSTASQVRYLLSAQHVDAGSEVNLSSLDRDDDVAICVFDVSRSDGLGDAKQLVAYATPDNHGIGLIALG
jgi:hypothetical protein